MACDRVNSDMNDWLLISSSIVEVMGIICFSNGNSLFHMQKQSVSKSETPMKQSCLSVGDDT